MLCRTGPSPFPSPDKKVSTLAVKVLRSSGLSVASTGCNPLNRRVMSKEGRVIEVGMWFIAGAAGAGPSCTFWTSM